MISPSSHNDVKIVPVILAGGIGSRLWPLSRESHPKPFIRLNDNQSLIQKTYLRATSIEHVVEVVTVTNQELFFYTKDQYAEVSKKPLLHSFILEPFGRNSAPAIALASLYAQEKYGPDCILLILSADHMIQKLDAFCNAVDQAVSLALQKNLVTFGIKPEAPETGYGYIETHGHKVIRFVEKPSLEKAQTYLDAGNYFWNSGMFCMSSGAILDEINTYCPRILEQSNTCMRNAEVFQDKDLKFLKIRPEDFESIENISIDYAIFEKSNRVNVVPCDIGWSDIGSWVEFGKLHTLDPNDNHILGETALEDVQNCIIHSTGKIVAGIGLKNLVIADTQDALLVADKNRVQDVRTIVQKLKERHHESYQYFSTVHRPWGSYTVLQEGHHFKIKRIEVKPGSVLSLQSHKHRSEHWVVVQGFAEVFNDDQILRLERNQSTYIPLGNKHRLKNVGQELLIIIEVQCGDYLGEDDIVRYEDIYGRAKK